jgi:hypothetical protein
VGREESPVPELVEGPKGQENGTIWRHSKGDRMNLDTMFVINSLNEGLIGILGTLIFIAIILCVRSFGNYRRVQKDLVDIYNQQIDLEKRASKIESYLRMLVKYEKSRMIEEGFIDAEKNEFTKWTFDKNLCPIRIVKLSDEPEPRIYKTNIELTLKTKPSYDSDKIRSLQQNESVVFLKEGPSETVAHIDAPWFYVKTDNGDEGWCFSGHLRSESNATEEAANTVNNNILGNGIDQEKKESKSLMEKIKTWFVRK